MEQDTTAVPQPDVYNVDEFVNTIPEGAEEEENTLKDVDPTVRTLLQECERLSKERDDANKVVEETKQDMHKLEERVQQLADKLERHYLDPNEPRTKATEEEIQEYSRSVFGERVFSKKYTLAGNNTLRMDSLTDKQGKVVSKIVTEATERAKELKMEFAEATFIMFKLKMLWHLRAVNEDEDNAQLYGFPEVSTYQEAMAEYDNRFGDKSDAFVGVLVRIVKEFSDLLQILSMSLFDENFYKGAGLR
jgi:DNA repair ATPase RecN